MNKHEKINYVELPAKNIKATKDFFSAAFCWEFVDYGDEYTAFSNEGIDGGFYKSDLFTSTKNGSALIIFYSKNLEESQAKIEEAGGRIIQAIFSFPGGRRFHFEDPNGNEYAVWSGLGVQFFSTIAGFSDERGRLRPGGQGTQKPLKFRGF